MDSKLRLFVTNDSAGEAPLKTVVVVKLHISIVGRPEKLRNVSKSDIEAIATDRVHRTSHADYWEHTSTAARQFPFVCARRNLYEINSFKVIN